MILIGPLKKIQNRIARYAVYRRFLRIGILLSGFLLLIIGVLTFYGQYAGNFVITITPDSYERRISISDDPTFTWYGSRLFADPVADAMDMTYEQLKIDKVIETDGNYKDPNYEYVAYTFYLKNMGIETLTISMVIDITEAYMKVDEAIRVLLIEEDTEYTLYQKPDQTPPETPYEEVGLPPSTNFINDYRVCEQTITNFRPDQVHKYSVLIWLEGYDPDDNNDILGGMIKLQMVFDIIGGE